MGVSNKQQKKQWKYVENREIKYVVSKVLNGIFTLKDVKTGNQIECNIDELVKSLK